MGLMWGRVCASRGCEAEGVVRALVLGNRGLTEGCIRVWGTWRSSITANACREADGAACAGAKGDREVPTLRRVGFATRNDINFERGANPDNEFQQQPNNRQQTDAQTNQQYPNRG